jgi:hypothetical protein
VLLVLVVTAVDGFAVGGGAPGGLLSFLRRTTRNHYDWGDNHASSARWAVRLAAEAKNASEISHETLVEYREKLSIIPRANGDDTNEVSSLLRTNMWTVTAILFVTTHLQHDTFSPNTHSPLTWS